MFIISFKIPKEEVDEKIELLQINEIYDVYYESPLEITTDNWGYGYVELDNILIDLNIAFHDDRNALDNFIKSLCSLLNSNEYTLKEEIVNYEHTPFPAIHLDSNWVLASPEDTFPEKNKINFISQGAFGTGLHETTQDILRFILNNDFTNNSVLDIGTGSGILSLAAAIKGASKVTALDIRNVKDEVELNASLNNINNIEVLVGDALSGEITIIDSYDWIFINIGGEETQFFLDFINYHLKSNGKLLVSGLVEWSLGYVVEKVENSGFKILETFKTNEWCTAIFDKLNN